MDGNMAMILGIIAVVFVVVCVFLSFVPLGLWISALSSGVQCVDGRTHRHEDSPHQAASPRAAAD